MPKVSIITVVYNGENELQKTIDSVVDQDYGDTEYIIIDGGSSDGTLALINANLDAIDNWVSEKDNGIYDAMNKGILLAKGEFVIFMNAGDYFYSPDAISRSMLDTRNYDVIYGNHWILDSVRNDGLQFAKSIENLKYGMVCSHQSVFFRRNLLLKEKFSLDYGTAGDYELMCRLASNGYHFYKLKNVIISYFMAGGVSDQNRLKSLHFSFKASRKHFKSSFKTDIYFYFRFLREAIVKCAKFCIRQKNNSHRKKLGKKK